MARHKDKEHLKELEMAKKRDHKIMITDEAIRKVPRIKYKNIPENEYDTIQELARNVLRISKNENNSNEVAITYEMNSMKHIQNGEDYIGVAVLHNHPSLSDFSLSDVQFLLRYESIKMMIVVTNLGSISYLVKSFKPPKWIAAYFSRLY